MIRLDAIHKRYSTLDVLKGVSLDVRPGAVTALVGPNASGKTTLIKILLGLARADTGRVLVDDREADVDGTYRRDFGYMPQAARFPDNLRVADVFELVSAFRAQSPRDEELVTAFNLAGEMHKPVRTLSGGTRQKVSAAIAFLFRPALLVLDEPTAGLDPLASGILKDKIRAVRAEGRTVIVTSHVSAELESFTDDVAFLCDGMLQFNGTLAELLAHTGQKQLEAGIATLMRRARPGAADAISHAVPLRGGITSAGDLA